MKLAMMAAAAAALIAGPALARHPVTRDEARQETDFMFRIADANHDGVLTRDEAAAFAKTTNGDPARATAMFDTLDTARSGRLTVAQIEADRLAKFDRADANHDGVIDDQERAAAKAAMIGTAPMPAPPPR